MNVCDFGTVLRQLQKGNNLTQSELGSRVGLSKAVVSKYENGMAYPTYGVLIQIAEYFGVTTDYLWGASKGKTIDVSALTDSQIDAIHRIIAEFNSANKK